MSKLTTFFGAALVFLSGTCALLFFGAVFTTLAGYVSGWIVGLFFGDTFLGIAGQYGLHGVTLAQLGGFLGFFGSFFRSHLRKAAKS